MALLVVNALGGLGLSAWSLRWLRTDEVLEHQRTLDRVRWGARRGPPDDAATR